MSDTGTELAALVAKRDAANDRISSLEGQQREAVRAREDARAALIEYERRGDGPRAERARLEKALSEAEATVAERWSERVEGAKAALRDAQGRLQTFAFEHLDEILEGVHADGEFAADAVDTAAKQLVDAFRRREEVAGQIYRYLALAGVNVQPGAVSLSRAEQVSRAAADLLLSGGEDAPRLRHDPRQPIHGAPLAEVPA